MTAARRNLMWPVVLLALGVLWLLVSVGTVPDSVGDLLLRAWPALLILLGLDVLLGRRRLRLGRYGLPVNVLGLLALVAALAVVVWLAYQEQADVIRADNVQTFDQALAEDINQLQVEAVLERTAVTGAPAENDARLLRAGFSGSRESDVEMAWQVQGSVAGLAISENQTGTIPHLEDYGRGTLDLALPADVAVSLLRVSSEAGDGEFDLGALRVDRLEVTLGDGSLYVALPAEDVISGALRVEGGGIELRVPAGVALTVSLAEGSGEPSYEYDNQRYDLLRDGTLKLQNVDEFQAGLTVWLGNGATLRVVDLP